MFVDGTLQKCCRVQGVDDLQREIYDGHHRAHGLVYQGVVLPNGLIADLHGPVPGRRHDAFVLNDSTLNERLANVQAESNIQYKAYGDATYPNLSHIERCFRGANLTPAQREYNRALSLKYG